jgi:hypothetical protein
MAAHESLDTLVDLGRAFLSKRRMQAVGGSNSIGWGLGFSVVGGGSICWVVMVCFWVVVSVVSDRC